MKRFNGFTADSFEQLSRALAIKILGSGVTAFGDGPDGGREATFHGKVNHPHPPNNLWDGYGVIQAKFKSKSEGVSKDQAWALAQLKTELNAWIVSSKRKPRPDYFIYCTNVSLTSATGGGIDQLKKALSLKKNKLKGFSVWDANQMTALIDGCQEIRQRFCHLFTTGDLLAEYAKNLDFGKIDAEAVLGTYLAREFLADEDARLSQAGDRSEDRIRLADVFVDLPCGDEPAREFNEIESNVVDGASLSELLRAGAKKLDPLALNDERVMATSDAAIHSNLLYGRYVYLGGPGSGKSTIGQFLAQIHRAALLNRRPPHRLEPNVLNLISSIKKKCDDNIYAWPATPRYPFRIELNAFAKALSKNAVDKVATLSEYLRREISKDVAVRHEDLRSWLAKYPWLLIFDGLDEVPASSNRKQVISAIQEFLGEARDVEADLLIVASSRPDGYAGEFDGNEVAHRYLLPLSPNQALVCAQKYVDAKIARKDEKRAEDAMQTLRSAVENPLVAKLMHSPLQVTFMVTVVAASGKPSESRWQLFSDYYRTIYERELHKAVPPFDKALNERRSDIDALHHRVGFILQTRAESSGGTQSDMAATEFEKIVRECLDENGLPPEELKHQLEMIIGAAGQRLVFLTSRTPDRLSFDVRSLQEYMAAACITNADSSDSIERLKEIAHSSYWRNVLLFAVGRFFVEPQMRAHRDRIRLLCEDLNMERPDFLKGKIGSRLALDILAGGVIGNIPLASRGLSTISLQLLDLPADADGQICESLASIYKDEAKSEYTSAIEIRVGQSDLDKSLSAWRLLKFLSEKEVAWAESIVEKLWPKNNERAAQILESWIAGGQFSRHRLSGKATALLEALVPVIAPDRFLEILGAGALEISGESKKWLLPLIAFVGKTYNDGLKLYLDDQFIGVSAHVNLIDRIQKSDIDRLMSIFEEKNLHPGWSALRELIEFESDPSRDNLIKAYDAIVGSSSSKVWERAAAWPLLQATMINSVESIKRIGVNERPWTVHQQQFEELGVDLNALLGSHNCNEGLSFAGVFVWSMTHPDKGTPKTAFAEALLRRIQITSDRQENWLLSFLFAYSLRHQDIIKEFSPAILSKVIIPAREIWDANSFIFPATASENPGPAWEAFFENYGRGKIEPSTERAIMLRRHINWLSRCFQKDNKKTGILKVLAFSGYSASAAPQGNSPEASDYISIIDGRDDDVLFAAIVFTLNQPNLPKNLISKVKSELISNFAGKLSRHWVGFVIDIIDRQGELNSDLVSVLDVLPSTLASNDWRIAAKVENLRGVMLQASPSGFVPTRLPALGLPSI